MSWFKKDRDYDAELRVAQLNLESEKFIGEILEFIKQLEILQCFINQGQYREGRWMAEKCCENPIISCEKDELPTDAIFAARDSIFEHIAKLEPMFRENHEQGLYNIAQKGNCAVIVDVCRKSIETLRIKKA